MPFFTKDIQKIVVLFFFIFINSCVLNSNHNENFSYRKSVLEKSSLSTYTAFNLEDEILLSSIQKTLKSFYELSNSNLEKSFNLSKEVLYTPGLTPEIYKFALKSFSIAKLILIDQSFSLSKENRVIFNKDYNFNDFQLDICNEVCGSIGWSVIAQNIPFVLTPDGYSKFIVTKKTLNDLNIKFKYLKISNIIYEVTDEKGYSSDKWNVDNLNNSYGIKKDVNVIPALRFFIEGKFQESIQFFKIYKKKSTNLDTISLCDYWIGRNYFALKDYKSSKQYFLLSGITNPLNLYDALSGQMLKNASGRASTVALSPFIKPWNEEIERWIDYPNEKYFSQINIKETFNINIEFIKKTIKSSILLLSIVQENEHFVSIRQLQDYFLNLKNSKRISDKNFFNENIISLFLNDQINWLKFNWPLNMKSCCTNILEDYISSSIIWLMYSTGDFLHASFFINQVKDHLDLTNEKNDFFYFIFYPLPYKNTFKNISLKYGIDKDILYSIYRQNSLFFMKPLENDIENSAFKIKDYLIKYNYNLVYALTAYKSGSNNVDKWLKINPNINDNVLFIEFIPNENDKIYVSEILRNYYNIKWIYSDKEAEKWWEKVLFLDND